MSFSLYQCPSSLQFCLPKVLRLDRGCAESALNLRGQVQAGQGQGPGNQQNNSISIEIQTDQHRIFQVVDAVIEQRSLYVMKVN